MVTCGNLRIYDLQDNLFLLSTQGVFSGFAFVWFHHSSSLKKLVEAGENVEDNVQVLRSWVSIA